VSRPGIKALARNTRGGVILEFALSTLLLLTVLLSTLEFGLEMFVRQSSERAASAAAMEYSTRRSVSETQEAVRDSLPVMMYRCSEPLEVRLFDSILGVELAEDAAGRAAQDDASDASAVMARVSYTCRWDRLTPVVRGLLGPVFEHEVVVYTRMRD